MKMINLIGWIFLVILLTIMTQIGGLILIICIPLFRLLERKIHKRWISLATKPLVFAGLYLLITLTTVPQLAKPFGRVPLPVFSNGPVQPLNVLTCVMNRHYVTPEMHQITNRVAGQLREEYPEIVISYLDANFPFIHGFPLIPHLSHSDGEKLDLAFLYQETQTDKPINNDAPSFIGYGVYERPLPHEVNWPRRCRDSNRFYSSMQYIVPQYRADDMELDAKRTKDLILQFDDQSAIGDIFIEPHLRNRMTISKDSVEFQGCHSVRHDDHIHVQLK